LVLRVTKMVRRLALQPHHSIRAALAVAPRFMPIGSLSIIGNHNGLYASIRILFNGKTRKDFAQWKQPFAAAGILSIRDLDQLIRELMAFGVKLRVLAAWAFEFYGRFLVG
jgi:hypothetical protein